MGVGQDLQHRLGALSLGAPADSAASPTVPTAGPRLRLVNARARAAAPPPTNVVHVYTNDGEFFPVKKALLRPCIALTKVRG